MKELSLEESINLISYLKQIDLCLRCQIRYLGEIYSSAIFVSSERECKQKIDEILKNKDEIIENDTVKRQKTDLFCFCCVGLLQNGCEDKELDKVFDKINNFEFKFKTFQVNLFLPISITIRENIVNAKLINKFPELESHIKNCYTIKDVYRFILIRNISKITDSRFNAEAKTEIKVETSYGNVQIECMELYEKCKNLFNYKPGSKLDAVFNHTSVTKALSHLGLNGLLNFKLDNPDRSIIISDVNVINHPLYLVGRYNKFSRELSQTPWIINENVKKMSLEEIITEQVVKYISCQETKFSASGREDVDVRMLGRGRPFVIELSNPRTLNVKSNVFNQIKEDVKKFSNNDVDLNDLQFCDKDDVSINLKKGESSKAKIYSALCILNRNLNNEDHEKIKKIKDLKIFQDTPIRVLHRRSLSTRPKIIHEMEIISVENEQHKFNLKINTEAGTYIKEFIHGDFGRTSPSLATILGDCEADILQLDVLEVCIDWPPKID